MTLYKEDLKKKPIAKGARVAGQGGLERKGRNSDFSLLFHKNIEKYYHGVNNDEMLWMSV
jgi:hypothetical protein